MPQILSKLDQNVVFEALRRRDWAFHSQGGVGLRLTKADPNPENKFKTTGKRKRILMTPISKAHMEDILHQSRNVEEAVRQIEAISLGAQLAPEFAGGGNNKAAGVDPAVYEKLLTQRIENEVSKVAEKYQRETERLKTQNEALAAKLEALAKPKKVATGKRKQPKGGVLARVKKQTEDEPELTPEQQKLLAQVMGGADAE